MSIAITWNGHACFTLTADDSSIVLDPYSDGSVPGYGPLRLYAQRVLTSHGHGDHAFIQAVTILPESNPVWEVETIASWHDSEQGRLRGANTIHILKAEGLTVAHLGDLGCELGRETLERLKNLDAVMIPVGGFYTIDAVQAQSLLKKLCPRVVIPMHYRSHDKGLSRIGTLDEFLKLRDDVVFADGNTLMLDADTPAQTCILQV